MEITCDQALRFRFHRQQLDGGAPRDDCAVLDLGVQDTGGPGAARWALAIRGCELGDDDLLYAWTLRGAPHAYRRREAAEIAAATAPYDEADAAKRVFDASKPLKAAGIRVLDALDTVAGHMRDIVVDPTVKGAVSSALTERVPDPYLRWCRPCQATHLYEQPFRLSALRAGLELEPGTSPPVLRRIDGWDGPAAQVPDRLDAVRASVRLLGPTTPNLVAAHLDAPVRTVTAHWPEDTVTATFADGAYAGTTAEVLAEDHDLLADPPTTDDAVQLLGAFDPWLQVRDRELLVADEGHRTDLWRVLGRPGAVLVGHEVVGTWRPRSKGEDLRLHVEVWDGGDMPDGIEEQAERLAAHRGQRFAGWAED